MHTQSVLEAMAYNLKRMPPGFCALWREIDEKSPHSEA